VIDCPEPGSVASPPAQLVDFPHVFDDVCFRDRRGALPRCVIHRAARTRSETMRPSACAGNRVRAASDGLPLGRLIVSLQSALRAARIAFLPFEGWEWAQPLGDDSPRTRLTDTVSPD